MTLRGRAAAAGAAPPGRPPAVTSRPGSDPLTVNGLLHGELRTLRSERTALAAALASVREQHAAAARQWETERRHLCGGGGAGSDAAAARIMELARRQRHLTAELEGERARRRRLEARLMEPAPARAPLPPPAAESASDSAESGESAAQLRERLRDTTRRLVEARNQAGAARRELRQAERLLQQEVGEGVSPQQLLAAGSGWRGRAQQIVSLKAQLQAAAGDGSSEPRLSAADCRARSHLRSLGREQQAQARQAAAEAERQAEEAAALRLKLDAARSRAAVLAQETTQLRETTARLSEKCRNDDEMIELLEAQVRRLEAALGDGGGAAAPREARQAAAPVHGEQLALVRAQLAAREADVARLERQLAERPAAEEPPPSPPPPAAEPEELAELRRRCLEAEFTAEAAAVERRRLSEAADELQQRLAEVERRGDAAAAALAEERRAALGARRETERLRQVLGRGRRPAQRPAEPGAGDLSEGTLLREEVQRVTVLLETAREERRLDLQRFEQTMEEAREIFCRGLRQAQADGATG